MFRFRGGIKRHLKPVIQDVNRALLDTLAAYGDVNRLVSLARSLWPFAYLTLPQERASFGHSSAFKNTRPSFPVRQARQRTFDPANEIWLGEKVVVGDAVKDIER